MNAKNAVAAAYADTTACAIVAKSAIGLASASMAARATAARSAADAAFASMTASGIAGRSAAGSASASAAAGVPAARGSAAGAAAVVTSDCTLSQRLLHPPRSHPRLLLHLQPPPRLPHVTTIVRFVTHPTTFECALHTWCTLLIRAACALAGMLQVVTATPAPLGSRHAGLTTECLHRACPVRPPTVTGRDDVPLLSRCSTLTRCWMIPPPFRLAWAAAVRATDAVTSQARSTRPKVQPTPPALD